MNLSKIVFLQTAISRLTSTNLKSFPNSKQKQGSCRQWIYSEK
uniref:Uncharacterized protein n=1 Tax=Arundo donax TaxID=35708 RepID=A0A0A9FW07_ARUDO